MDKKALAGIGIIGLVGAAGLYLASRGDAGGDGGGLTAERVGNILGSGTGGLTAKGEAVSAKVDSRQAAGFMQYTGVGEVLTAQNIGKQVTPTGKKLIAQQTKAFVGGTGPLAYSAPKQFGKFTDPIIIATPYSPSKTPLSSVEEVKAMTKKQASISALDPTAWQAESKAWGATRGIDTPSKKAATTSAQPTTLTRTATQRGTASAQKAAFLTKKAATVAGSA